MMSTLRRTSSAASSDQPIALAVRGPVFDGNVLSLHVAEIAQPLQKRLRRRGTGHSQITDPRYFLGLLRLSEKLSAKRRTASGKEMAIFLNIGFVPVFAGHC